MATVDLSSLSADAGGSAALTGYFAQPTTQGPWPAALVLHETFGLDEATRRHVERLATMGYLALAPDLFSDGGTRRCLPPTVRAMQAGEGKAFADIEAARQWLLGREGGTGRVVLIGFSLGGSFALQHLHRGYDVVAANYGALPKDLAVAVAGGCPVIANYGGKDRGMQGLAGTLETALVAAGVPHEVIEYPAAGHSFLNDSMAGPRPMRPLMRLMNAGPDPDSAALAWQRIERFFGEHLR